jgi:SAF domain-containing protein
MTTTTNNRPSDAGDTKRPHHAQSPASLLAGDRRAATGPQKPRNRSWGLVTLAALLVVALGLGVAAWGLQVGDKSSVLALGQPVSKGQVVERGDLVSKSVAGVGEAIPVEDIDTVVGQTAAVDLVAGQILTPAMVAADPVPGEGQSVVGLALDPTRVPSAGLEPGDQVDVIAVPAGEDAQGNADAEAPEVLAEAAEVYAVGGEGAAGGQLLLTVVVDAEEAAKIAAYSTQNRVAVVETAPTPRGDS